MSTDRADAPGERTEWNDPAVFDVGSEPPHATLMPFSTLDEALTADRTRSPYRHDLDGVWHFRWAPDPGTRLVGFVDAPLDAPGWDLLPVPSSWQLHGYDFPIGTNITLPWTGANGLGEQPEDHGDYPWAPTRYNPVGQYRTQFRHPAGWEDRRTFLHFDGVESAFFVWVNGQRVGYREDSYTASRVRHHRPPPGR